MSTVGASDGPASFAFRWTDRFGRRKLSMGGYAGMCLAVLLAAHGLLAMTGTGRILACFAALAVIASAFVYRYLPETKNHFVEEVTELVEREAAGQPASRLASQDADAAHC